MQKNAIFRKASLDRVSSPEQLNDYIKVSRPGVWLILGAVVVLLIGVCVWGVLGSLTTTCDGVAVVQGGAATCYVSVEDAKALAAGMEVQIDGAVGSVQSVAAVPVEVAADFDAYALYLSGLKPGDWVVPVEVEVSAPNGAYMASIVVEAVSPISFVLN
ncbi:MAG: hypothetical protein LKJ86_00475 [Oscillibacter sp.]|nr:hypothetical protein [Oscillibacter sp.]